VARRVLGSLSMTNHLETIDLSTVFGGDQDFAGRYTQQLKDDWRGAQNRADRATAAQKAGRYGEAAKQWGAAAFDDAGLIGDAIAPFKSMFG
jgi:hypothetical protein